MILSTSFIQLCIAMGSGWLLLLLGFCCLWCGNCGRPAHAESMQNWSLGPGHGPASPIGQMAGGAGGVCD